jgi:hypothetical protein
LSETFDLLPLRFHCTARARVSLDANFLRGGLGKALRAIDQDAYHRLFTPRSSNGPSGLRDVPRPFVFRASQRSVATGESFEFGFPWFDLRNAPIEVLRQAFAQLASVESIQGYDAMRLSLDPVAAVRRMRVKFVTPTELKGADRPDFDVLFARIRDRISTLRAYYGSGPLDIDFRGMGQRASKVLMTRCEIERVEVDRVSRSTGQRHSLGGFVGVAEYEGELSEFVPYLEVARWTGVGRQTVWGKGEIACDTL